MTTAAASSMATGTPSSLPPATHSSVERSVKALLKWRASKSLTLKPQLLEQDEFLYLILTLKKIPQRQVSRVNPYKIPLPHPLFNPPHDNTELCLFIDDRPKSGLNKSVASKKVQEDEIPISKIIKISKLRTDYRPFEAKRKLCDSYDLFLADKRVIPLLPKMLGKQFFKKKKIPVGVDLIHTNWREQVEKACGSALLFLRTGTCSVVKVGRVSMATEDLVENVVAAINGIAELVPRKWGGIRSFHLKLLESLALPVYQALPDLKLKIDGASARESDNDNNNVEKEKVEVNKKNKQKQKGRIHEVRYMDSDAILDDEDVMGIDDNEDGDEAGRLRVTDVVGKKRKSREKVKPEKKERKMGRVKKENGIIQKKNMLALENEGMTKKKRVAALAG